MKRRKDPRHRLETRHYADVSAVNTTFGEKLLTTTLNPVVLAKWMLGSDDGEFGDSHAVPFTERYALAAADFVMAVDSDAIFTRKLGTWNLMAEANNVIGPRIFGQDASWYWPRRFRLTLEQPVSIVPTNSRALVQDDWREYAAIALFVAEVSAWQEILPTAVDLWGKLAHEQRYIAVPIAAAHEKTLIAVSGVLSVHRCPLRYQNWDFVDDIKHNLSVERVAGKNLALSSYPISIRALNYTLPQWIAGVSSPTKCRQISFMRYLDDSSADWLPVAPRDAHERIQARAQNSSSSPHHERLPGRGGVQQRV